VNRAATSFAAMNCFSPNIARPGTVFPTARHRQMGTRKSDGKSFYQSSNHSRMVMIELRIFLF
jgi:hypothetical protein